ncbi:MAG: tRNA uridine-5-carboxymethylaminomethyl(34) synthesis GTPase MnmE, partial [Bacteroidales bacterium]|nr:tRNA uridine-5-carboxymethylaminomethyl(34) synthesis GTPase MnmE [Bacteroidales bacterium]
DLTRVSEALDKHLSGDLLAEDLRAAISTLGSIFGEITTDDLLGEIFSKFCIGK